MCLRVCQSHRIHNIDMPPCHDFALKLNEDVIRFVRVSNPDKLNIFRVRPQCALLDNAECVKGGQSRDVLGVKPFDEKTQSAASAHLGLPAGLGGDRELLALGGADVPREVQSAVTVGVIE